MKSSKGFTLIETIIAMALIMIAVFVFTPIFALSFKQISDAGIWQNVVISQRANVENQLAGRSDILNDNTKYPPYKVTINLHDDLLVKKTVDVYGKIISDTLVNRSNIKSFISNIYGNESKEVGAEIIVFPKTIYYKEELKDKSFTVYGVNLTFTEDLAKKIKIYSGLIDVTTNFDITFDSLINVIKLTVKIGAPNNFFAFAPFKIIYSSECKPAWITVLSPQIIAVTNTGDFITGYENVGKIIFSKGIDKISSGSVNDIVYNFQKREYIAVGDSNLFSTFGNSMDWVNINTTDLPSENNNYAVSVDRNNNYMIGSSYNTIAKSEVLLSVENNNYHFKPYPTPTTDGTVYSIEAKWFDLLRSTSYVNIYNQNNEFDATNSSANDYILAIGNYGVKINDVTTYYDLIYATKSDLNWFDISVDNWFDISVDNLGGTPSNKSTTAVKMTGIASGVGRFEQKSSDTVLKSADFSILLVCTDNGKLYGVSPEDTINPMIDAFNTHWKPVIHAKNIDSLKSIAYGNNKFIAVGSGVNNIIIGPVNTNTSDTETINFNINIGWIENNINKGWTENNIDGMTFEEISFINYKFYAVGTQGGKGVIYSSADGSAWEKEFTTADNCTITSIAGE